MQIKMFLISTPEMPKYRVQHVVTVLGQSFLMPENNHNKCNQLKTERTCISSTNVELDLKWEKWLMMVYFQF